MPGEQRFCPYCSEEIIGDGFEGLNGIIYCSKVCAEDAEEDEELEVEDDDSEDDASND